MLKASPLRNRLVTMVAGGALILLHGWAVLALFFWFSGSPLSGWGSAVGYALAVLVIFRVAGTRSHGALAGLVLLAGVVVWWTGRRAEPGLVYPKETEHAAKLEVKDSRITVHGIRDFRYRSVTDFKARWVTRTYELPQLEHVDLFFHHWGWPDVAHVITSFVFTDQPPLAVSIELRAERDEPETLLRGCFKQYELLYVWADERDVIALRTNQRKEPVYLYRTTLSPDQGRRLLMDMAERSNGLEQNPGFYNTLTDNGNHGIARHVDHVSGHPVPWYRRPLRAGKYQRIGYDQGWLEHTLPFEAQRAAAWINDRALQEGDGPDFSQRIRTHLPAPEPSSDP